MCTIDVLAGQASAEFIHQATARSDFYGLKWWWVHAEVERGKVHGSSSLAY